MRVVDYFDRDQANQKESKLHLIEVFKVFLFDYHFIDKLSDLA